jgi:hypothetical protein
MQFTHTCNPIFVAFGRTGTRSEDCFAVLILTYTQIHCRQYLQTEDTEEQRGGWGAKFFFRRTFQAMAP